MEINNIKLSSGNDATNMTHASISAIVELVSNASIEEMACDCYVVMRQDQKDLIYKEVSGSMFSTDMKETWEIEFDEVGYSLFVIVV